MARNAALVFVLLYLQSVLFVEGGSLTRQNLVNIKKLGNNRYRRLQEANTRDITIPMPTMVNSIVGYKNRSDEIFGIYANFSAWGQKYTKADAYSETVIEISNEQGGQYNAIRAGLHTLPSLYNDTKLHFFAQWTKDRDWKTGCYNTDCPGFVPFNNTHDEIPLPGMVFDSVSSYDQIDYSIILQIVKDERPAGSGLWWLYRVMGPARLPLGYWPPSLFTSLAKHATEAAWYGAVGYARRGDERPAMGSGHGPEEGYMKAAYFADISLMDNMAYPVDQSPENVTPMIIDGNCYGLVSDGDYRFYYGGPLHQNC